MKQYRKIRETINQPPILLVFGMNNSSFDVVVLGGINQDYLAISPLLPKPGQTVTGRHFQVGPGGKGANQAVAASRLGARVALLGSVGDDLVASELKKNLQREGVNIQGVQTSSKAPTGSALIMVDASGEKAILACPGANSHLRPKDIKRHAPLISSARVLLIQFEVPPACALQAAKIAWAAGVTVILDPAPPARFPETLFKFVHIIRPNADEAEQLTGIAVRDVVSARKAARKLIQRGVQNVILQAGDKGDLLVDREGELLIPRLKVRTVDATGAGDAFAGGLAAALAAGEKLPEAVYWANATAALSTTKVGAQGGLPTRTELLGFLKRHPPKGKPMA